MWRRTRERHTAGRTAGSLAAADARALEYAALPETRARAESELLSRPASVGAEERAACREPLSRPRSAAPRSSLQGVMP